MTIFPTCKGVCNVDFAGNDDGNSTRTVIIILVPIVASLLIAACVGNYVRKRLKKKTMHITLQSNPVIFIYLFIL